MDAKEIFEREIVFHDEWAASTDPEKVDVYAAFEAPTSVENQFILSQMGSLAGKRLLDIGAGLGESSVYFALQGAEVTTSDISKGMVDFALALGRRHGVEMKGVVAAGEELQIEHGSYDFVYAANTVHHVTDRKKLFAQFHRALKPGGKFFTWDPMAYNPVIKVYRRLAMGVRTEDEKPLTRGDIGIAQQLFTDVQHREFWIFTLLLFLKYFLIDCLHPGKNRYWKLIYDEDETRLRWWMPLLKIDNVITRWPLVRWLAWNMVMWGTKEGQSDSR